MNGTPIANVDHLLKVEGYCRGLFRKGVPLVGNTKEQPVQGSFIIPPSCLTALVDNLLPLLPVEVIAREEEEYNEIIYRLTEVCKEEFGGNVNSRRAVFVNPGCVTYQHLYIREGVLYHIVHMRSQDLRKFLSDFWLFFRIQQSVLAKAIPDGTAISRIEMRWAVDNFHVYLKPEEVPL